LILVDTSIWINHLRARLASLETLVALGQLLNHPFVTSELAVGDPREWGRVVALLRALPPVRPATETEFLELIAAESLAGTGLGFVDVHLLASCRLTPGTRLWSGDKRLARYANRLGIAWADAN
jgi:predicted nucleic acid-binding protein